MRKTGLLVECITHSVSVSVCRLLYVSLLCARFRHPHRSQDEAMITIKIHACQLIYFPIFHECF